MPIERKVSFYLLSLILITFILYVGQSILFPIIFSVLFATLLLPINRHLEAKGLHRTMAILITVSGTLMIVASVFYFLTTQVASLLDDMPTLQYRLNTLFLSVKQWIFEHFNISTQYQDRYLMEWINGIQNSTAGGFLGKTLIMVTGAIPYFIFLPVYTFLILYYRGLIRQFVISVFKNTNESKVREVLRESITIARRYSAGLMIEMLIVFALNAAGFYLLGIKYALFMGLLAALLNLIPYIGMLVALLCCMLITVISCTYFGQIPLVATVLVVVHLIDNGFIMPLIIGSKVRINALAIIIGIVTGGALFGIFGMFLAIPTLAVLKVICDRVDTLQPYGMLLGEYRSPAIRKKVRLFAVFFPQRNA